MKIIYAQIFSRYSRGQVVLFAGQRVALQDTLIVDSKTAGVAMEHLIQKY